MRLLSRIIEVSALKTAYILIKQGSFQLLICWRVHTRIDAGGVSGKGLLTFGSAWPRRRRRPSELIIEKQGHIEVNGRFRIFSGSSVDVSGGRLVLGSGYANTGLKIVCRSSIAIGDNVAIGDDVLISDTDFHSISNGVVKNPAITIGDRVWIGSRSTILKGVKIGSGSVIGSNSVVSRDVPPRSLVVGNPAFVVRDVDWRL